MAVDQTEKGEKQETRAAKDAFDKVDEDGNGYIPIDELHDLAASLGLPITPGELDGALEVLDEDNDGVLDREGWVHWWVERWKGHATKVEEPRGVLDTRPGFPTGGFRDDDREGVNELAERARRAHKRASTDIHAAAWSGDLELVKDFLDHDPEAANAADNSEFGMSYRPLHYAAYGGFLDVCRELHAAGARALAVGDNGVSALFLAAQAGRSDVVRFLLDLGADPTLRERESGLCAADVGALCPDILVQMREKFDLCVPRPLEAAASIQRVGATSLQVAFLPLPEAANPLPVTRYKIKVDEVATVNCPAPSEVSDATEPRIATNAGLASGAIHEHSIGAREHVGVPRTTEAGPIAPGVRCLRPSLVKIVLIPARCNKPSSDEGGRTVVSVRGLRPETRYRVQIAAVNAMGFGSYGPSSKVVCTAAKSEEDHEPKEHCSDHPSRLSRGDRDGRERGAESPGRRKAKGRQVLAMEKRRMVAAETRRLREQQQRTTAQVHRTTKINE